MPARFLLLCSPEASDGHPSPDAVAVSELWSPVVREGEYHRGALTGLANLCLAVKCFVFNRQLSQSHITELRSPAALGSRSLFNPAPWVALLSWKTRKVEVVSPMVVWWTERGGGSLTPAYRTCRRRGYRQSLQNRWAAFERSTDSWRNFT